MTAAHRHPRDGHDHHGHDHDGHAHVHGGARAPRRPVAVTPGLSLLRMSAAERLIGVAVALAVLWSLVFWALR